MARVSALLTALRRGMLRQGGQGTDQQRDKQQQADRQQGDKNKAGQAGRDNQTGQNKDRDQKS